MFDRLSVSQLLFFRIIYDIISKIENKLAERIYSRWKYLMAREMILIKRNSYRKTLL